MPIQVICPSCHARFQVSEKFAGKSGPCPKCKGQITIPNKSEEVVIHTPENFGPPDTKGRAVLKPIEREETEVTPIGVTVVMIAILMVVAVAAIIGRFAFQSEIPIWFLGIGAVLLAPTLVFAAYTFLRDAELQPYRGTALGIRIAICSAVYAGLWLGYYLLSGLWGPGPPELFYLFFIVPGLLGIGGLAAFATLDLDFGNAVIHCSFYILVTVILRAIMGLPLY